MLYNLNQNVQSKFKIGEHCIALNLNTLRLFHAHVINITTYQTQNNENVVYTVQADNVAYGDMPLVLTNVPEPCTFKTENEVFDWAAQIIQSDIE